MTSFTRLVPALAAASAALLTAACEVGPKTTVQHGFRGAALQQTSDPDNFVERGEIPAPPYETPADEGPRAREVYQNVQVLGDVSAEQFNHLMAAMNQWIAPGTTPDQGCAYCHNLENLASDEKYTKVVARRMVQMTRSLNGRWSNHVQQTGVTCWTCHRGNAVPEYKWARAERVPDSGSIRGNKFAQNTPEVNVGYASLPYDPFDHYFNAPAEIRVASDSSYPSPRNVMSIKDAEESYGLMMHLSQSLGVNCTYCHNSQAFKSWGLSRAQRGTAYYGIRMVRDVNAAYISTLAPVFPANRKGVNGDPYKVNCMTCHQGLAKPLNGVSMLPDHPTLRAPAAVATAGAAPVELAPTAAVREEFQAPGPQTLETPAPTR